MNFTPSEFFIILSLKKPMNITRRIAQSPNVRFYSKKKTIFAPIDFAFSVFVIGCCYAWLIDSEQRDKELRAYRVKTKVLSDEVKRLETKCKTLEYQLAEKE